jgi:hypothetical protein
VERARNATPHTPQRAPGAPGVDPRTSTSSQRGAAPVVPPPRPGSGTVTPRAGSGALPPPRPASGALPPPRAASRPVTPRLGSQTGMPAVTVRPVTGPRTPPPRERLPPGPRITFPPAGATPPPGADELIFEDFDSSDEVTAKSSLPMPLGQAEQHDAWTMDRLSRQSTVPPVRRDDFDRLLELSALPLGEAPTTDQAWGGALDLVDRSRPLLPPDLISEMEELYALDDLTGALRYAELILGRTPDDEQALRCAANCRGRLIRLYSSKIGRLDRVVSLALGDSQLRWLGLDHRSGFLLSRVDGVSTLEELLDVCGMPRLEALKTLADLLERGAIKID